MEDGQIAFLSEGWGTVDGSQNMNVVSFNYDPNLDAIPDKNKPETAWHKSFSLDNDDILACLNITIIQTRSIRRIFTSIINPKFIIRYI